MCLLCCSITEEEEVGTADPANVLSAMPPSLVIQSADTHLCQVSCCKLIKRIPTLTSVVTAEGVEAVVAIKCS